MSKRHGGRRFWGNREEEGAGEAGESLQAREPQPCSPSRDPVAGSRCTVFRHRLPPPPPGTLPLRLFPLSQVDPWARGAPRPPSLSLCSQQMWAVEFQGPASARGSQEAASSWRKGGDPALISPRTRTGLEEGTRVPTVAADACLPFTAGSFQRGPGGHRVWHWEKQLESWEPHLGSLGTPCQPPQAVS